MKIAIYGRILPDPLPARLQVLFDELKKINAELYLHKDYAAYIAETFTIECPIDTHSDYDSIRGKADYLLSIGGDGTLLETISFVRNSGIPILGINTGRLGFLAFVSADEEIRAAIKSLTKRKFILDKRTLLKITKPADLFGDVNFALNELTIQRKDSSAMMTIHTYVDGVLLNSYWADGLIIATPTGSTAYSLSCGGPLMVPEAKIFSITPLAPHNLNVRPLVVPDDSTITLRVEGRNAQYLASLDSRTKAFDVGVELTVQKEDFKISLVRSPDQHFFNTIRNKLMWGLDQRN
ncbi:MAG: NAD+ kinase [Bacteroidetes bacterium]|nr:MAG: NAD+ kinase [Bacteroidota bacterium]